MAFRLETIRLRFRYIGCTPTILFFGLYFNTECAANNVYLPLRQESVSVYTISIYIYIETDHGQTEPLTG